MIGGKKTPSVNESFDATGTNATQRGSPLTSHGIWVAVRVRPFNKRELEESQSQKEGDIEDVTPVVELERDRKTMTLLDPGKKYGERGHFTFDYCFSAFNPSVQLDTDKTTDEESDDEEEAAERAQSEIYRSLGQPIVNSAWAGYNGCIFAYGQTSSGKTYTMMGTKRDPGIIPRLCRELFEKIEDDDNVRKMKVDQGDADSAGTTRKVTKCSVSYMEIYNEKVKDLLIVPNKNHKPQFKSRFDNASADEGFQTLRVRQHPLHGPFVEGLSKVDVNNWLDCVRIIRQGNEMRSSAHTSMNDQSSRSHAIFQIVVTQTESLGAKVRGKEVTNHRVSKINLVDLAGSERAKEANVSGKHATEANYINKSLSTLRRVIDILVSSKKQTGGAPIVVPYRESLLTWILSDNFGGNSKTAMIANVSPHYTCFLETESTLRYATLAKGIVNRVRVNEDPSAKLIKELQSQLKALQAEMSHGPQQERVRELEDQMEENKRAMEELLTREEGMRKLIQESRAREAQLRSEKETLEKEQSHWKQEAERLEREKEELRHQLTKLAEEGSPRRTSLLNTSKKDFWATEEGVAPPPDLTSSEDVSCPPQSHHPHRPSGSARPRDAFEPKSAKIDDNVPAFLKDDGSPKIAGKDGAATTGSSSSLVAKSKPMEEDPDERPLPALHQRPGSNSTSSMVLPPPDQLDASGSSHRIGGQSPGSTSPSPSVRYGRRAATEEGKERDAKQLQASGANGPRTAEMGPRKGRDRAVDNLKAQPGGPVPVSLQHLMGPVSASPSTSPTTMTTAQKQSAGPDALDAFLSGGTPSSQQSVSGKKERVVPPWRQRRGGNNADT